jgi:DNA-binding PadR family transcriptional regulator
MQETDDQPLHDLTAFQRDLLAVMKRVDEPIHGIGIKERLEEQYEEMVNHGRLYPNLDDLVEKGLVDKGKRDDRTNEYRLTSRGQREFYSDLAWRTGTDGPDVTIPEHDTRQ